QAGSVVGEVRPSPGAETQGEPVEFGPSDPVERAGVAAAEDGSTPLTTYQAGSLTHTKTTWTRALNEIAEKLRKTTSGSVAIVASARQTNEELWLLSKLKAKLNAISDSVPRL